MLGGEGQGGFQELGEQSKDPDEAGSVTRQGTEERDIPSHRGEQRERAATWGEWKWRCHLEIWWYYVKGTSHFQRCVAFKRCFLRSISKMPVPHWPIPKIPIYLVFSHSPRWLQCGLSPSTTCSSCPCSTLKTAFGLVTGAPVQGKQHRTGNEVLGTNNSALPPWVSGPERTTVFRTERLFSSMWEVEA